MGQVFHWLLRITTGLLVLAVLVVVMVYYLASRSLPEYDKVLTNGSLISDVEIVRDNNNIPHIFAATDQDVFFGLGYVHAQDRLWQMIVMRRTAQGRLSEVFGTRTVDTDKLLRRLDLYGAAKASLPLQDPQTQEALAAYAQGVNARLAEINRDSLGRGAPELFLFNTPISPCHRQHCHDQTDGAATGGPSARRGVARADVAGRPGPCAPCRYFARRAGEWDRRST